MTNDHIDAIQEISTELAMMSHYLEQASRNAPVQHLAIIRTKCDQLADLARTTKRLTDTLRSQATAPRRRRFHHVLAAV